VRWWSHHRSERLAAAPVRPLSRREAYDRWAPVYPPVPHNPLMLAEQEAVVPLLRGNIRRALDVGAGTGRYARLIRAAGAGVVVSLDWSLVMLAGHAGGARVCGDARRLPFAGDSFDLVNASLVAGDVTQLGPWLEELARVLTPGGRLVYSDFHPAWRIRGWTRTFRDPSGQTIELSHEPHDLDDHRRASHDAGLVIRAIQEVRVPLPPTLVDVCLGRTGSMVPGLVVVAATRPRQRGA